MEITTSISMLITIGGIIVSIATAFAIVKTKVAHIELLINELSDEIRGVREEANRMYSEHGVKIAVLEKSQETQEKELEEMKADIKEVKSDVKEVLVTLSEARKGGK